MTEETMRMTKTGRKRRIRFAALSMVTALTALAIQSEPASSYNNIHHNNNHHRPSGRQRVLSSHTTNQEGQTTTTTHHDLLHYFDAVWKDVSATTASTETIVPKCIMPNGEVIGISVATTTTSSTTLEEGSRKKGMKGRSKSRRRRHRGLHSSSGSGSTSTLASTRAKKSKKGSRSKISSTFNVNPSTTNNATSAIIDDQSLPLCNVVGTLGEDGNITSAMSNNTISPGNNNNQTTNTSFTTELDRCTQIAMNINDNTDSNTAQLTMTYTVFSDSDLTATNLNNLQKFFQRVVGPTAAGCPVDDATKEEALHDQRKKQRQRRRHHRFLQGEESEIRRLSFDTPSVVTAERGGGCGSIHTEDASSTCTVLAQDVTMNYVGDVPNIRGLLLVATMDSLDPATVLALGLTGVSDITVLAQPPTVAAPTLAPVTRPTTTAPPPTNLPPLKDVTGNNNPRPNDNTAAGEGGGGVDDGSGPVVSSVNRGEEEQEKKTLLAPGAIAGILLACIFALLAIVLLIRRQRRRPRSIACRKNSRDGDGHYTSEDEELSNFLNDDSPRSGGALDHGGGGSGGRKLARVMSETSSHSGGSVGRVQHIYSFPVDADGFPRKSPSVIQVTDSHDEIEVSSRQQQSSREIDEAVNRVPTVRMLSPEEIPYRPNPRFMERNYMSTDTVQL